MPKNRKDESSSDSEAEEKSHKKTKRESKKKDDSDSDSGPDDRNVSKKSKPAPKKSASNSAKKSSDDDDNKWSIGKNRFAALREFKGNWYIDIREYYNADGEFRPGKKGIMLHMEQWQKLKNSIPDIDEAIKQNV